MTETCENCGTTIGRLETPQVHDGHVVCAACKGKLVTGDPVIGYATAQTQPSAGPAISRPTAPKVQTIELTAKKWKLLRIIAGLVVALGLLLLVMGWIIASVQPAGTSIKPLTVMMAVGVVLLIGGVVTSLMARFGAWWNHG